MKKIFLIIPILFLSCQSSKNDSLPIQTASKPPHPLKEHSHDLLIDINEENYLLSHPNKNYR